MFGIYCFGKTVRVVGQNPFEGHHYLVMKNTDASTTATIQTNEDRSPTELRIKRQMNQNMRLFYELTLSFDNNFETLRIE